MRHDDYKLIVDGVELENPGLRIRWRRRVSEFNLERRIMRCFRLFVSFYFAIGFGTFIGSIGGLELRLWSIVLWPVIVVARLS